MLRWTASLNARNIHYCTVAEVGTQWFNFVIDCRVKATYGEVSLLRTLYILLYFTARDRKVTC